MTKEEPIQIKFDKIYRYDRVAEPCSIAIPVKQGMLKDGDRVSILDGERVLPSQTKVTSRYQDGSVRYLFTRFLADLPGNAGKEFSCRLTGGEKSDFQGIRVKKTADGFEVDADAIGFVLRDGSRHLFEKLTRQQRTYTAEQFVGPMLQTDKGAYEPAFGKWTVSEQGAVCAVLRCMGSCSRRQAGLPGVSGALERLEFECRITVYAGKPWLDISCRLINTTDEEQHIISLVFGILREETSVFAPALTRSGEGSGEDSTGCGDMAADIVEPGGELFITTGIRELPEIEAAIDTRGVRTCVGHSNYKTTFTVGKHGRRVCDVVDAAYLVGESNEHFAEVFYGTFFCDVTDSAGGVCATVFQAQQNYPKAVMSDDSGIYVMLVPEGVDRVVMASGMSREQRFQLHFHDAEETLTELDNRSLIYQMPDTPHLMPEVFRESGVCPDIFVPGDRIDSDVEIALINKADNHARCYGMMNWGDAPDPGYTAQGRGKGRLVWTNNEYDYPHSMYLLFARTGVRRFLDYANVAASHWMDVDVCHYSADPLRMGGQWEHTMGHCGAGVMVCSHEWVEGLIDCYHFTGNERALKTALGIGENILRLLETPMYQKSGESNARETGWALRTLTALYIETWDEKWVKKCRWIVGHFKEWIDEYGEWVATYTDNTTIRVGFMISVAIGSLMRYYRVFGGADVREMILSAVNDLVDNCLLENGLFYYKELPSLARNGSNTLLLEAMTIGYELTGEKRYLEYGRKTFEQNLRATGGLGGGKRIVEDTVISGSGGTKGFAQSFIPMSLFYKALTEENML